MKSLINLFITLLAFTAWSAHADQSSARGFIEGINGFPSKELRGSVLKALSVWDLAYSSKAEVVDFKQIKSRYLSDGLDFVLIEAFDDYGNQYSARIYSRDSVVIYDSNGLRVETYDSQLFEYLHGSLSLICHGSDGYISPEMHVVPLSFAVCTVASQGGVERALFLEAWFSIPRNDDERELVRAAPLDRRLSIMKAMSLIFLAVTYSEMGDDFLARAVFRPDSNALARHLVGGMELTLIGLIKNKYGERYSKVLLDLIKDDDD